MVVAVEPAVDESLFLPPREENASPAVAENVPKVVPAVPVSVPQSMPTVKERPMPSQGTIIVQPGPAMKNHLFLLLQ